MVIKCDICFYTELKVWPGHGKRCVQKGKLVTFLSRKAWSLNDQKIKAQRLTWTQAWRRKHKKGKVETATKKKIKRTGKVYKAIQGISMDEIRKRREQKPEMRTAQREAALREIKERKKKTADEKKKATGAKGPKAAAPVAKNVSKAQPKGKGTARR